MGVWVDVGVNWIDGGVTWWGRQLMGSPIAGVVNWWGCEFEVCCIIHMFKGLWWEFRIRGIGDPVNWRGCEFMGSSIDGVVNWRGRQLEAVRIGEGVNWWLFLLKWIIICRRWGWCFWSGGCELMTVFIEMNSYLSAVGLEDTNHLQGVVIGWGWKTQIMFNINIMILFII